jgi:hypothetical protein
MAPVELAAVDSTPAGHWKADGSGRFDLTHDPVRKVCNLSGSCARVPTHYQTAMKRKSPRLRACGTPSVAAGATPSRTQLAVFAAFSVDYLHQLPVAVRTPGFAGRIVLSNPLL